MNYKMTLDCITVRDRSKHQLSSSLFVCKNESFFSSDQMILKWYRFGKQCSLGAALPFCQLYN